MEEVEVPKDDENRAFGEWRNHTIKIKQSTGKLKIYNISM
jgi:hypothetical protein